MTSAGIGVPTVSVVVVVRVVLPALAAAWLIALAYLRGGLRDPAISPVADPDPWLLVSHLAAGVALLGAGTIALATGVSLRAGIASMLAGLAWFGPDLARLASGPPILAAVGPACSVLVLPLILHLVVSATSSGPRRLAQRVGVIMVDAAAIVVAVLWLLAYAPFYDLRCTYACNVTAAVVDVGPAGRALLREITHGFAVLAGASLALVAGGRLRLLPNRSAGRAAALCGGLLVGLAGLGIGLVGLSEEALTSLGTGAGIETLLLTTRSIGGVVVACGVVLIVRQVRGAQRRIRDIATGMPDAPTPGTLASSLARALDDEALRVGYRLEDEDRHVNIDGGAFELGDRASGRSLTPIQRHGMQLGVIDHRDDIDAVELSGEFRPSMLVALDNERLRATQLAQLRDLQASRARIVELGDAERRRIERDIHDGAQQRLLAIAFDLRLGRITAERDGRHQAAARLAAAEAMSLGIVDELRRICQGIHPQVLAQAGLEPALTTLAEESAIPLEVRSEVRGRLPVGVESAAYQLVTEALEQATRRGAAALCVEIARRGEAVTIQASDDGRGPLEVPLRLADRVGAVGGHVMAGLAGEGAFLRAELPCA